MIKQSVSWIIIISLVLIAPMSLTTENTIGSESNNISKIKSTLTKNKKKLSKIRRDYKRFARKVNKNISGLKRKAKKSKNDILRKRYLKKAQRYRTRLAKKRVIYKKRSRKYISRINMLREKIRLTSINTSINIKYLKALLKLYKKKSSKTGSLYKRKLRKYKTKIAKLKSAYKKARSPRLKSRYRSLLKRYKKSRRSTYIRSKKSNRYYRALLKKIRIRINRVSKSGSKSQVGVFMENPYSNLPLLESKTGKKVKVFLWYQSMAEDFDVNLASWLRARGTTIQLAFEPHNPSKPANNQPEYRLSTIAAGQHDGEIYRWAQQIKAFGGKVYFRPMCEMNGNWTAWSGTANGNRPAEYIPAWRRIRNIFKIVGANNAIFVWAPNRDGSQSSAKATYDKYYPGNAYVDMIGLNGYNWGTMYNTPTWTSRWQSFTEVFGHSYSVYARRTNKNMMISEMASTEKGGSKAAWIKDAFSQIKYNYPRIKQATWFNINKETDWRVNNSSINLNAFKTYAF